MLKLVFLCTSNVCRSPIAEAISAEIVASSGLSEQVTVCSRGLTDAYSEWGHGAEPRMVEAAKKHGLGVVAMERLTHHGSQLLAKAEAADARTVLFLVTAHHVRWTAEAVGGDVVEEARAAGRLRLIDSSGADVADPYFGGQEDYDLAAAHLVVELPRTLETLLRERGLLGAADAPGCLAKLPYGGGGDSGSDHQGRRCVLEEEEAAAAVARGRQRGEEQGAAYAPPPGAAAGSMGAINLL